MPRFKIATTAGGGYEYENEALAKLDAGFVEAPVGDYDAFMAVARDADAVYGKGPPISRGGDRGLNRCRIIALGSVVPMRSMSRRRPSGGFRFRQL